MVKFMFLTQKQAIITVAVAVILWILLLLPLLQRFVLLLPSLWDMVVTSFLRLLIMIKRPPFIYILFNFIIVYILLSPVFSLRLKFYNRPNKPKPKHDFADVSEISSSCESKDDTWWCRIVADGEDVETVPFREGVKTASFEIESPQVENISKTEEEEEGDDTLDATWKAIMETKSGPQLKKSNTWSSSKRGNNNLGQYQVVELKKWQTFKKQSVKERESCGGGGGGVGGEGRRKMDKDELKKRADDFIASFTHDIRLQRLESDQRFLDTINRGL